MNALGVVSSRFVEVKRTTEEWEQQLGGDLRRQRIAAGLTMQELADRANVSIGAVRNLEHGRGATTSTLVRVVRALGRTDWLSSLATEVEISPIEMLRQQRSNQRPPQRVRRRRTSRTD